MDFDLANLSSVKAANTAAVKNNAVLIIKSLLGLSAVILLGRFIILSKRLTTGNNLNLNLNLRANAVTAAVKKVTAIFITVTAAGSNSDGNKIVIRVTETGKINIFVIAFFYIINALI